jgi:hypothetical protein
MRVRQRRRIVPRAKYTKPPEPLPPIEQIQRSNFRFRKEQWQQLTKLLPYKFAQSEIPPNDAAKANLPSNVKTLADGAIQATEDLINSYLSANALISKAPTSPNNVRVAIRLLREALKPFIHGAVDSETADIVPADLESKLASRDKQLAKFRLPSERRRLLVYTCELIARTIRGGASKTGETVSEQDILRYVDIALAFARIKHPRFAKHRKRLAAMVFPKD